MKWLDRVLGAYALCGLLFVGCGCQQNASDKAAWRQIQQAAQRKDKPLLTVRFDEQKPLRYRMVSERTVEIRLTGDAASERSAPQKTSEKLELTLCLTPEKSDPFGLSTLRVVCESAKVTRSSFSGRDGGGDAVEFLPKIPYAIQVSPLGQMERSESFDQVIQQLGQQAFSQMRPEAGRIKDPDMINDFLALHQSFWLAASSQPNPADGIAEGKQWTALQMIPWPLPMLPTPTRQTTWTVQSIQKDQSPSLAVITSSYAISAKSLDNIPLPYEGPFQMRGLFGFLRNYRFETIEGQGQQVYDLDAGAMVSDSQRYTMRVLADFALPLGNSKPVLNVEQTLTIERLDDGLRAD